MKKKNTGIVSTVAKTGQSVNAEWIIREGTRVFRFKIRSDSYAEQSFAIAELWSGSKWEAVYSIPYSLMETPFSLYSSKDWEASKNFDQDFTRLLSIAREVTSC